MYDASNRKDIRRAEKDAKLAEQQRREVVFQLMATIAGRHWILNLLEKTHTFATSYSKDPYATAFSEGERNIGLQILGDVMQSAPDQYIIMMREANERRTVTEHRGSKDLNGGTEGRGSPTEPADDDFYDGDDRTAEAGDERREL